MIKFSLQRRRGYYFPRPHELGAPALLCVPFVGSVLQCDNLPEEIDVEVATKRPHKKGWRRVKQHSHVSFYVPKSRRTFYGHEQLYAMMSKYSLPLDQDLFVKIYPV